MQLKYSVLQYVTTLPQVTPKCSCYCILKLFAGVQELTKSENFTKAD